MGIAAMAVFWRQEAKSAPQRRGVERAAPATAHDPEWEKVKYGDWGGPGVSARPGPMDSILLKDYAPRPSLVVPEHPVLKAKYPVVDVHAHVYARNPEEVAKWAKTMDDVGIETMVVLASATGEAYDKLAAMYLKPYPKRFQLWCGLLTSDFDKPDYSQRAVAELERCYKAGARGVGELSDKGSGYGRRGQGLLHRDKRLHPDDPRLDAFWEKCADLKMPVNIHIADHPSCWTPLDVYQERTPDYQHFNQYGRDVPSYEELIAMRDRLLAKHPRTTFIACHLGNQGQDLGLLGKELDKYPNLYLDMSARDYELGRQPRAALKFLTKYRNRVMFGDDIGRRENMYRAYFRLFETEDEFMPGRMWWRYYGLGLPAPALRDLYQGVAKKVLNWQAP